MGARRFSLLLLGFCGLLTVTLWLVQVNPYLNPADDSGRYMILGESIAKTGEMRLINDVRQPRDTLYVPGFPALIAALLRASGLPPGRIVPLVKGTQLALLLCTLPLFLTLLRRARLEGGSVAAAMIAYAACPALVSYADEVMSEMPLLFLCLASIVLATTQRAERAEDTQEPDFEPLGSGRQPERRIGRALLPRGYVAAAIGCAVLAYYVRAAGVVLLISLIAWFWFARARGWAVATLLVTLLVIGGWQMRTAHIIATDPPGTPHDTYMRQFTLRDPDKADSGRIQPNLLGIGSRLKRCLAPNIGNISRSVLYSMGAPKSAWHRLFFVVAVPFTLLVLYGFVEGWRRRLYLVCGFSTLFFLFITLWPWISPRFLVPLIPYTMLFAFVGADALVRTVGRTRLRKRLVLGLFLLGYALLLAYFGSVHAQVVTDERRPVLSGYAMGRSSGEAGFYAACGWLAGRDLSGVVMSRPAYLAHLYSGHPTTQIEPSTNPRVQEKAYMVPNHVRYLLDDRWNWSHSQSYLAPYLEKYGSEWTLVWQDSRGSGVRVFRRNPPADQKTKR